MGLKVYRAEKRTLRGISQIAPVLTKRKSIIIDSMTALILLQFFQKSRNFVKNFGKKGKKKKKS